MAYISGWSLQESIGEFCYSREALDHLAECLRDEIDDFMFNQLFEEVDRDREIVESIIPQKLFEV